MEKVLSGIAIFCFFCGVFVIAGGGCSKKSGTIITGDPCSHGDECPEGWYCDTLDTGKCRPVECTSNDDCKEGEFCDTANTQACHRLRCSNHKDCPLLWLCDDTTGECYNPDPTRNDCIPARPGCPCTTQQLGQTIGCRAESLDPSVDISCRGGQSVCDGERWGPCVDEYNPGCDKIEFGPRDMNPTDDNSANVKRGIDGELLLDPDERSIDTGYVWIANSGENTVSKMDVSTGKEVARYPCVMDGVAGLLDVPIPYPSVHAYNDCAHCPSRTAIDYNGDAYVANRAFGALSSVTKFANSLEDCIDRDGDGVITTSTDVNGDGMIDLDDPDEFPGFNDECVLWTVAVGGNNGVARAIAIDPGSAPDMSPHGNVWVGLYNERKAVQLSGEDGSLAMEVDLGEVRPYGAAIDGAGRAWFTGISDGMLVQVDTFVGDVVSTADINAGTGCPGTYGIAVDVSGRIWLGGWDCNTAIRYNPADDEFATIEFAGLGRGSTTRGIAPDLDGNIWVAHTDSWVTKFDGDTMTETNAYYIDHHLPGEATNNTIGVGIDRYGAAWVVSRNDLYAQGTVTRILSDNTQDGWPAGLMPYTYSDFTGFGIFSVVRPMGWYNVLVSACEDEDPDNEPFISTDWQTLDWIEHEPPGTTVRIRFKVVDDLADLPDAPWWGPFDDPPVDLSALGLPNTRYMLVQILMAAADPSQSPAFGGFTLEFDCGLEDTPVD